MDGSTILMTCSIFANSRQYVAKGLLAWGWAWCHQDFSSLLGKAIWSHLPPWGQMKAQLVPEARKGTLNQLGWEEATACGDSSEEKP